ncbi:MATH and LRR domain-containing protein PFE0570w [Bicyclus anynana]|uniref:MATH and LRR domain-containing protein PFE0570w n=1 Tax=Bicyclus anynana TaxID=110368 RepID=A0A6J1NQ84_BICAN|nr:MATH and LRR domain-containing protein PFE0570w [Bicyclus anynana]
MTRFARAKGSKASNLKSPEDSTPWEVMKEQMLKAKKDNEENKNREEAEQQRIENYNNFLKEQKTQKRKATWCDFPEDETNNKIKLSPNQASSENVVKKKKFNKQSTVSNSQVVTENGGDSDNKQEIIKPIKNNKNKKKKANKLQNNIETSQEIINPPGDYNESNEQSQTQTPQSQQKNKKKRNKKKKQPTEIKHDVQIKVNNSEKNINKPEHEDNQHVKNKKKKKKQQVSEPKVNTNDNETVNEAEQQESNVSQPSPSKIKKVKKDRRKPVDDKSFKLIINAKEVHLVRFDGFPIMKKDAERLEELKKSMIQKGIPKSEVQRTMKLERRRAEKALARLKREVCYNCRKGGHNLSDCPDLKANIPGAGTAEGVCFKCGSTEHRQFECKVQRDKEFRFATCFICKEAGHIARQCPDNPKGLYPNGGSCKLCGDVTHLRKDCPTVKDEKEGTTIKLQTLNDDNIEDIGQNVKQPSQEPVSKKPKKVKF